jgi:sigma-B regulation protein RsbU (phosphoserine phosphatase)
MVHFDTTITPIVDDRGRATHHMAVKRDITEEIQRRKALADAQEELERTRQAAQQAVVDTAVKRAKRDEELQIATRVQTSILPRALEVPGYAIAATMIPATEVGGDYYDLHRTDEAAWLAIGDVSGKGLDSGLVMMMVQSGLSAIVRVRPDARPREMIEALNGVLHENIRVRLRSNDYVTFSLFRLSSDGRVIFAGAHEDVLIWRARTRKFESIPTPGVWLGMKREVAGATVETRLQLEQNDMLVLHTDGIIMARNAQGKQLELSGLSRILEEVADRPVEAIRDHVIARTRAWMAEQRDDMSIVIVRKV